jgi:predicted dehydrogenase/threonine dehydrogenase-like Zn-dependent dehydrogenase
MRQILQHLRTGAIEVADVPCPNVKAGHLLIQTTRTLISAGTERMLVEFGRGSLLAKARAQPEKVKQVLQKIKTDGLMPTLETVFNRLDEPLPMGYCNVGRVIEVGAGVSTFQVGDRVVSNGPHAEIVCVPATLAAKIPPGVSDDVASFTVLGAISLNGVRLLQPTFGERFVVIGLGLLGQLAVQLLRSSGCHVLGIDPKPSRCDLARQYGAETSSAGADPVVAAETFSSGRGVDGVLITASAKSDEIMHQAATMCRKRGRIVLVGTVPLNLQRADFYEKEISFQVACSYGPGRYDPVYEEQSRDYPLPYVRWTEGRNFEAMLDAFEQGWVDVQPLITDRIPQSDAQRAYDTIASDGNALGIVLTYPEQPPPLRKVVNVRRAFRLPIAPTAPRVGVIGAGLFTKATLLPALKAAGADIVAIASSGDATTDYRALLRNPDINTVFITTRHDLHPKMVVEALNAGKHVFVEKPLAIDREGLEMVREAAAAHPEQHLMVGFNRRFAPHTISLRQMLRERSQPISVLCQVNAGALPVGHWLHDPAIGGGRVIGEGCHFIDLVLHIVGHPITSVQAAQFGPPPSGGSIQRDDKVSILLTFADGSIGTVHYWSNGGKSYAKERVEVFSEGRVAVIDNWRTLQTYDWKDGARLNTRQDKGHRAEIALFLDRISKGGPPLISFDQLEMVTAASFAAVESARDGKRIEMRFAPLQASDVATPTQRSHAH